MSNLFSSMKSIPVVSKDNVRVRMTPDQVTKLKDNLKKSMAMNVYPNQFDVKKPYHVTIRFNNEFTGHGNFANLEVARMVGNIAGMAQFGKKALSGAIKDSEATQAHPEFITWMNDSRNQETIAQAELNFAE